MKLALFIHEDYDFTFDLLHEVLPRLSSQYEVVGILTFPNKLTKYQGVSIYKAYLNIFGFRVFKKLVESSLKKRIDILYRYLMGKLPYATFQGLYNHCCIKNICFKNPNDSEPINWIKENRIDIVLQFAGYILKSPVIKSPKNCILNKHAGLLPSNKGVFPIFWSLLHNEPIAVTIHKVNEEIDGGEIVFQRTFDRHDGWSVYDYYQKIFSETPDILIESLSLVIDGSQKKVDHALPTCYRSLPTRNNYLQFKEKGNRFI